MKPGLDCGLQAEVSFEVTEEMCPAFEGRVVHRVCATWTLVHYMEVAGRKILIDYLESDEEGVGSHVSCDHTGPAAIGRQVRVVATAAAVDRRELVCETAAYCRGRRIATGRTVQRVFPRAVLARILEEG